MTDSAGATAKDGRRNPGESSIFDQASVPRAPVIPRAIGTATLAAKPSAGATGLDHLRTSGCLKALFGRNPARLDTILINTAGGLTGGDRLDIDLTVKSGAQMSVTTQAAERAYRASSDQATVRANLTVADGGTLLWLPQELILFDGAALNRSLTCDLTGTARALIVEPVVFGRTAMGEHLTNVHFRDRIAINHNGAPLYRDVTQIAGDLERQMARPALGRGAGSMAALLYAGPDAEAKLAAMRAHLPTTGGASLIRPGLAAARIVAEDSMALRASLLPLLDSLTNNTLPVSWRL